MRSNAARVWLAIYLLIWFGIIVPGHRPGIVVVGSHVNGCCCDCCACRSSGTSTANGSQAPSNRPSHCEICNFAAHLTVPPPVDFTLDPLRKVDRLPDPIVQDLVSRRVLTPFDSRGPPVSA